MKVIIIEDEKLSAEHLHLLLQKIDGTIEVVKYIDTVKATIAAFQEGLQADLLFMDIHLADGNSFEIFSQIQMDIPIIFTTAYDNYAIQAFKKNSIDYLLKPISIQDLQFAIEKYKKQLKTSHQQFIENVANAYRQMNKEYKTRFLVKIGSTIATIQTNEISHFESRESISFLVTTKGNRHIIDYTLDQLETMLKPTDFFRINRQIIIHIQSIQKTQNYFNGRLIISAKGLENDSRIVSRERVNDYKSWLG